MGYQKAYEEQKKENLLGEESHNEDIYQAFPSKAFIGINTDEKSFNFGVYENAEGKGYGRTIYDNYLQILELLNIPDKEQYELAVRGSSNHTFLKRMQTKNFIARASGKPDKEKALQLLTEFSNYPNTMKLSELNTLIQYAIDSNIPITTIVNAINDNGLNVFYTIANRLPKFPKKDLEQFKSFGITGLKPTAMHHHFMKCRSFGFMKLLDGVDMEDSTLEFRRILEELKEEHKKDKAAGTYIYHNLEKYGELEHLILDWDYFGLLLKNTNPEIQATVKAHAINKFAEFDPEHQSDWSHHIDSDSSQTFKMLREAGLMDKDAYIALYQKALNRNYDLKEFDKEISGFISEEEKAKAKEEILRNAFYPSPRGKWQKSPSKGKQHKISRIAIPKKVVKKGNVIKALKQEILKQGIAKRTKIRTDMTGKDKDGKPIVVDNLKDWLFGVPGAHGNLQMMGSAAVTLPPQTPEFAVNLIENAFKDIEYPNSDGR